MKQKTHTVENNRIEGWVQEGNNAAVWNSMFNRNKGEKKNFHTNRRYVNYQQQPQDPEHFERKF